MENKKASIIIIIALILFGLIISIILLYTNDSEDDPIIDDTPSTIPPSVEVTNSNYIIIDDTDIWQLKNNNWSRLNNYEDINEKFSVYINQKYFGSYNLKYVNAWNLFDNGNYINYEGDLFAYTTSLNVDLKNYNITTISSTEIDEINSILNTEINTNALSTNEKAEIDLDNNGIIDKIVVVSNKDFDYQKNYFNLVYVILNGQKQILINDNIKEEQILEYPDYNINYIVNIEKEEASSIIIYAKYFSYASNPHNILFQYKNNKYTEIIN